MTLGNPGRVRGLAFFLKCLKIVVENLTVCSAARKGFVTSK
jgi:hypothetical protein